MLRPSILPVVGMLLFTGCLGFWVRTPHEIEEIRADQDRLIADVEQLAGAVEVNETLLRGLQAQSGTRTVELVEQLSALAEELDRTLARLDRAGGTVVQDTTAGPDAQLLFDEAYRQFQQGSFDIAAQGFMELRESFPASSLADDALYYMALCWDETGHSQRAIEDLVAVYYLYPRSEWAPGALFRAGDIYGRHGAGRERNRLFDLLLYRYPNSDEAALARQLQN